jgi:tryptophan synthase alpha chain
VTTLETQLRGLRDGGRRALVGYLVGGLTADWVDHVRAAAEAGCDLIEVGLPFSDPVMDGVVIQAASDAARHRGATSASILADLASANLSVPVVVMTYYNVVAHRGLDHAAAALAEAGVRGSILPDAPLEELGPWQAASAALGLACVQLVAPATPLGRVATIARATEGFLYAAARMAVTGEGAEDAALGSIIATARAASEVPIYAGIGIATPAQAARAAEVADGVIVGTAIVRRALDGEGARGVAEVVAAMRAALS